MTVAGRGDRAAGQEQRHADVRLRQGQCESLRRSTCPRSLFQDFGAFAKTVMAEKIKTLRNSLAASGSKAPHAQSQSTGATARSTAEAVADARSVERGEEGKVEQSNHHDIVFANRPTHHVEHPGVLDGWSVSRLLR